MFTSAKIDITSLIWKDLTFNIKENGQQQTKNMVSHNQAFWHVLFYFLNTSLSSALHVPLKVFVCECVCACVCGCECVCACVCGSGRLRVRERERERERKGENVRLWKTENFFRIINIWGQFHHRHFTTSVCDSWFTPIFLLNNLDNRV